MSVKPFKLLVLGSLGISVLCGSSAAFAQSNDDIVVPIETPGGSTNPPPDTTLPTQGVARFSCQINNGEYTVMYQPESQPDQYFAWATPRQMGGGWTPQARCNEIARRLEFYRPDGLQELRTGRENNYNTVCATTDANSACRIVFTVPPGTDANITRNQVFENLLTADSGTDTLPVYTFANRGGLSQLINIFPGISNRKPRVSNTKRPINLKPFLDRKDGGSSTKLRVRSTRPINNNNRLPLPFPIPRIFR